MKKLISIIILIVITNLAVGQNASVEKSIFGIETGLLGGWVYNESRLSNEISLRSEIGIDAGYYLGSLLDNGVFVAAPSFSIEPRWYYNLSKRNSKSNKINNNSGNFLSFKTTFYPDWFTISNHKDVNVVKQIVFIPKWGIRRNIGNNMNFELGIGIGYQYVFYKSIGYFNNEGEAALDLHIRIGYTF